MKAGSRLAAIAAMLFGRGKRQTAPKPPEPPSAPGRGRNPFPTVAGLEPTYRRKLRRGSARADARAKAKRKGIAQAKRNGCYRSGR